MSITGPEDLAGMRAAGAIVRRMLEAMKRAVRPGITTAELDAVGAAVMREHGAQSAPQLVYKFPGVNCISLNEEAVHGIPGERAVQAGDLVKLDVTIEKDGFMADAAETVAVGEVSVESRLLIACAERAFTKAMLVARAGFRVFEIGRVVEREVRRCGFSVIRDLGGHGIGRTIHEEPRVPNYADPEANQILTEGLVITVEPIIAAGSGRAVVANDGWTVRTADRRASAHFEHTLVITKGEPILLTAIAQGINHEGHEVHEGNQRSRSSFVTLVSFVVCCVRHGPIATIPTLSISFQIDATSGPARAGPPDHAPWRNRDAGLHAGRDRRLSQRRFAGHSGRTRRTNSAGKYLPSLFAAGSGAGAASWAGCIASWPGRARFSPTLAASRFSA